MKRILILFLVIIFGFFVINPIFAEDKNTPGGVVPKLPKTANDPELLNGHVYPFWGPVCQRYTYSVVYKDKEGRPPEYVKMYFNGSMIDLEKTDPNDNNYQKGVRYEYKYVPNKLGSNFYYFEASNGLGKTRDSIIDSPDNGPVLFESDFTKNEIAVIDSTTGEKILSFPTKDEWVGGIALSDDGKYLVAKTSKHIYFFDLVTSKQPLWSFVCEQCQVGGDVKGGVDISGDGSKIITAFGNRVALFNKDSNQPVWMYETDNSYNVAISRDGNYMAAATAGEESNVNSNLLILWGKDSKKPVWQYHSSGNFHDVSLSDNGQYIAGSSGCPDRKFYLFSKESDTPLIRTEMLTRDSPIHRAKISADGSFAAVGSESGDGAIFLFSKNARDPLWKFSVPQGSSVRALNFTPSGQFIGAATFVGDVYLFGKESAQPLTQWHVPNAALGGLDIADDGSFLVAGGTDNKVHIFDKSSQTGKEILFNEYVEEIDISGNGKYIAAGTGGAVYFFESFNKDESKIFPCTTIIEPKPQEMMGGQEEEIFNGQNPVNTPGKLPGMLFGFGFLGSLLGLGGYLATVKFNLLRINRKIIIILSVLSVIFLVLTIVAVFVNKNPEAVLLRPGEQAKPEPGKVIMNEDKEQLMDSGKQKSGCGNSICEPINGETKESCLKDCSVGN